MRDVAHARQPFDARRIVAAGEGKQRFAERRRERLLRKRRRGVACCRCAAMLRTRAPRRRCVPRRRTPSSRARRRTAARRPASASPIDRPILCHRPPTSMLRSCSRHSNAEASASTDMSEARRIRDLRIVGRERGRSDRPHRDGTARDAMRDARKIRCLRPMPIRSQQGTRGPRGRAPASPSHGR